MTPADAVFLAVAAALFVERPKGWRMACCAPFVAWGAALLPLGYLGPLVVALVVALPMLRFAPVALLLALPEYAGIVDVIAASAVWLGGVSLVDTLDVRLGGAAIPARWRGAPIRLLVVGILYYVLLPVFYL